METADKVEGNELEVKICRFCFETESQDDNPFIVPCNCIGSQQYVHVRCLQIWQRTILLNSTPQLLATISTSTSTSSSSSSSGHTKEEIRHLQCSTCLSYFHGVLPPTRLSLLELKCSPNLVQSLQNGCFLVTSKSKSERRLFYRNLAGETAQTIPRLFLAIYELKLSHWRYGVYFIFQFEKIDDGNGNEPILALNLTRPQNGSRDEPIPDEVLNEIEQSSSEGIQIRHHNGGPVNWSSVRTGTCILNFPREILVDLYLAIFPQSSSSTTADLSTTSPPHPHPHPPSLPPLFHSTPLYDIMNPTAEPHDQFKIWSISSSKSMIVGPFRHILFFLRQILHISFPHLNNETPASCGMRFTINSYSGYAKWSRAQLIQELSHPDGWGVVVADKSLPICGEYLESGQYCPQVVNEEKDGEERKESVEPNGQMSPSAAPAPPPPPAAAPEDKHRLWRGALELSISRNPVPS